MRNLIVSCVLISLLLGLVSAKLISSIEVDSLNGNVYVAESGSNSILHTVDNVDLEEIEAHYLPALGVAYNGLYVRRIGNKRQLQAVFEGNNTELASFKLSLVNKPTLPVVNRSEISTRGVTLTPIWDSNDSLLVISTGRYLSTVDLNSQQVVDTRNEWVGSRIFGQNVVYNHNNKHLIVFYTRVNIFGSYEVSAQEYDLRNKTFTEVPTTYDCLCNEPLNDTLSPFYKTLFSDCEIDYTRNKLWCADSESGRLFAFKADNLTQFTVTNTNTTFNRAVWDFPAGKVYTIQSFGNEADVTAPSTSGFILRKHNALTGALLGNYTDLNTNVDYEVAEKDPEENRLYIAVYDNNSDAPPKIVIVNTTSLKARTLVLNKPVDR